MLLPEGVAEDDDRCSSGCSVFFGHKHPPEDGPYTQDGKEIPGNKLSIDQVGLSSRAPTDIGGIAAVREQAGKRLAVVPIVNVSRGRSAARTCPPGAGSTVPATCPAQRCHPGGAGAAHSHN